MQTIRPTGSALDLDVIRARLLVQRPLHWEVGWALLRALESALAALAAKREEPATPGPMTQEHGLPQDTAAPASAPAPSADHWP